MSTSDEVYFACKKAYQELSGRELTVKLKEIFTPEIQAEMELIHKAGKEETRKMLNREYAKTQRDKKRVRRYGPKPKLVVREKEATK
jgi:hypothetical protein